MRKAFRNPITNDMRYHLTLGHNLLVPRGENFVRATCQLFNPKTRLRIINQTHLYAITLTK